MIYIENKKRQLEKIQALYPGAEILDVTSNSVHPYGKLLSPFYPHGRIPIPFSSNLYAMCVEGIWQGLKVFENYDVDASVFMNDTMKGLKRTVRRFGKPWDIAKADLAENFSITSRLASKSIFRRTSGY